MSNLAIRPDQTGFTPQQLASLKQLGVDKVADGDLAVFFHQCQRTGLDPFAKQIYLVGRYDGRSGGTRYTIQTGIDGYRLIAERTGVYAGSDEVWEEVDGRLVSATVTVRKIVAGQVCDFTATARLGEYVQTGKDGRPMGLWAKMPHRMLAKCAEALALRKAFPQDLSGLYTAEEMSQADTPAPAPVAAVASADGVLSAENFAKFEKACADAQLDVEQVLKAAGVDIADVRQSHLPAMRDAFQRLKQQRQESDIIDAEVVEDAADAAWVAQAQMPDEDALFEQVKEVFNAVEAEKPKQVRNPEQPATGPQMGKIKAMLAQQGHGDRAEQLAVLSNLVGRQVGKFDDLTKGEASQVIQGLVG